MPPLDRLRLRRSLSRKIEVLRLRKLRFRIYVLRHRRRSYGDHYGLIKRMSTADAAAMSASLLTDLFASVCNANEYYRAAFSRCLPSNWRDLPVDRILKKLPILTKQHLRDHFAALHTVGEFPYTSRNTSGGSTGQPVVLTQDANYSSWSNATQGYYFREFLGVEMNEVKNIWLWGSERDLSQPKREIARQPRHPTVFWRNQTFLNTFQATTDQRWLDYIDFIARHRPYYVAGYAGSLYQIAKVARRHNVRLYRPRFVYSAAETLRDFMREEIEEQFNAKVFDFYGSREVGAVAGECRHGRRHVFTMNNVVEVLPDRHGNVTSPEVAHRPAQSPTRRGDEASPEGRILVTNLHNRAFPLIRYEIGDTGAMGAEPGGCPCGSPLPTLAKLTGRVSDHFVRRDGALVHGEYFTHLFYFRPWVESFRVDQLAHGHIRVRVAPSGQVDEDDVAEITSKIRSAMDDECSVEWRYVDQIETSPQGKHLYTRSYVQPEQAGR